jgi:hypothetical protein
VAGSFAHGERCEIRAVSAQPCSVESIALRTLVGGRANRDVSSVPLLQTVVPGIRSSAASVSWPGSMLYVVLPENTQRGSILRGILPDSIHAPFNEALDVVGIKANPR